MKSVILLLSVACLGYAFVKDYQPAPKTEALAVAAQDDEPTTGNKTTSVNSVVAAAQALKTSLSGTNLTALQLAYTPALARKWSNLPCGSSCRNGVQFGNLTNAQLQLALNVIKEALGSAANDGYAEFEANRMAEAYLHANGGGNGYDSTIRFIAFLNEPSATGSWMLQFGGHHYAANISFNNGHVVGATPFFQGLEPLSFTYNGKSYAPLTDEHDSLTAMLASLSAAQLTTAKLSGSFSDCIMVPGETNQNMVVTFPAKAGLLCSTLSTEQKSKVLAVIKRYVEDMDATTAAAIMTVYTNEIDNTYIGYTGSGTSGNASSFLNANTNYARIDGPTVWIELACQNGVVLSGIHYHTVWRDHSHDYGVDLTGASIDGSSTSGVASIQNSTSISVYPNPAAITVSALTNQRLSGATVRILSLANGQTVYREASYSGTGVKADVSKLPAGTYLMRVDADGVLYTGKFTKL